MNEKKEDEEKEEKMEREREREKYKKKTQNVYENSMSSNCFLFHIFIACLSFNKISFHQA